MQGDAKASAWGEAPISNAVRMADRCKSSSAPIGATVQTHFRYAQADVASKSFNLFPLHPGIMKSILTRLENDDIWNSFIERKYALGREPLSELNHLSSLLSSPECRSIGRDIASGNYQLSIPRAVEISKHRNGKKRTVFMFNEHERAVLKVIAYFLYEFDYLFSDNLYSYRRNIGVKKAIARLSRAEGLSSMYGFKIDIHDYFNSIPVDKLMDDLYLNLKDRPLCDFFQDMLTNPYCFQGPNLVKKKKGIMAGVPTSPFLANYYLRNLDRSFDGTDVIYMRYADDIIVLAPTEDRLFEAKQLLLQHLEEKGLETNPTKEMTFLPGEQIEFLGFSIKGDEIDICRNTIIKIKGKIRRKARSIRRWMIKKNKEGTVIVPEQAIWAMIRAFNIKFYGHEEGEVSWNRWFFPSITTDKSLHEVDLYLQEELRYVATGRHSKKNMGRIPYSKLKDLGYRSLVHEYHKFVEKGLQDGE